MYSMDDPSPNDKASDHKLVTILGLIVVAMVFWDFKFFLPFKIFTVYLHELSHGVAATLTGGTLWKITLSIGQGGACYNSGGIREVVLSAGYMGSMFFGCLIFYGASKAESPRHVTSVVGGVMLLLTVLTLRNGFGVVFGFFFGGGLLAAAFLGTEGINEFLVLLMGVTNICYPLYDILDDVIFRTVSNSDAYRLGKLTGMASETWGFIWIVISLIVLGVTLYFVTEPEKAIEEIRY